MARMQTLPSIIVRFFLKILLMTIDHISVPDHYPYDVLLETYNLRLRSIIEIFYWRICILTKTRSVNITYSQMFSPGQSALNLIFRLISKFVIVTLCHTTFSQNGQGSGNKTPTSHSTTTKKDENRVAISHQLMKCRVNDS